MFTIGPNEAAEQDPRLVEQIAEYRVAKQAVAMFNDPRNGGEKLQGSPAHAELFAALIRAQAETLE